MTEDLLGQFLNKLMHQSFLNTKKHIYELHE